MVRFETSIINPSAESNDSPNRLLVNKHCMPLNSISKATTVILILLSTPAVKILLAEIYGRDNICRAWVIPVQK